MCDGTLLGVTGGSERVTIRDACDGDLPAI